MNDPYETILPSPDDPKYQFVDNTPSGQPQQIGRYRIECVLGKGGFGLVYLAHDGQLQRFVAIKVPHRELVERPEAAEAYLTEARTVANLDHPNIVPVYDVGSTDDCPCFIVSKYIDGTDLATRLKQSRLSILETVELVTTVAEALHHAHKQGLVHRDIKPGNLLLDQSGKPFVADFGLALREQDVGKGPRYAGTPAYMSPEQARGEGHRVDGRSDIFSLGVVFYQLLTGRRPFQADSREELLEQINNREVRPPRQWDDTIPKELERICLKALSKRASERFSTAKDLADDLRHFLESASAAEKSTVSSRPVEDAAISTPVPSPTPPSDQRPLKIVPKGLRSFDAGDADFFLELLPGPRDRDGLPESIRFWKTRIEETDPDNTFSVGLIYGPSGCGKSSLMKAGLLPRLAGGAIAVYVEATAADTEARLLKGLRKQCPGVPDHLGLVETLAALRRGHFLPLGKKVVLVLDQFEQWLHARRNETHTELVQALRHCDGGHLQCLVLVRDDFWLAVSRFLNDLEVDPLPGRNVALVDLFDKPHARKVLLAFGRAFGALPEGVQELSKDQVTFLDQAVAGLAQDGKIISVRLALFAEMVKGKPWTPATLKEVGGIEGVGVTFLDETFTAVTANPRHRLHQKASQAVLRALLPEVATDIKGHMRSSGELLEASGYANRPRDFEALLQILDGELRLITPTDPEGKEDWLAGRASDGAADASLARPANEGARFYQLTHDYLVPSLRDWLTRKQKETRRGRAELLLADRAAVWNVRPENRQLPSLWQWCNIRWLTAKKHWTPPQRKMMGKASRYHAVRGMVVVVLLALATATGLTIQDQVEEQQNATHAAGLVQAVLKADSAQVPGIIDSMAQYRKWTDPLLREENDKAAATSGKKLHTSLALLPVDAGQVDSLYTLLLDASPHAVGVVQNALAPHKDELRDKLWAVVDRPAPGKDRQRLRAASALAKYDPESQRWLKVQRALAQDLVKVEAVYLPTWMDALRPVRVHLLTPLAVVYGSSDPVERARATDILADYAADKPRVLAELVLNANDKQFAVIYPKFKDLGDQGLSMLIGEIDKRAVVVKDKIIFEEKKGMIGENDAKVKTQNGSLLAKRFEVRLQGGKTYRLTMDSQEVDSFLVLQDKAGMELAFDDDSGGGLNSLLMYTPASDAIYTIFAASLPNPMVKNTGFFVLKIVETASWQDAKEKLAKRQANAAVALLRMNQPAKVWPLLKHNDDPRVRSYLIHRFGPLGADARALVERLDEETDVTIRRALILSFGEYGMQGITEERQALLPKLQIIYRSAADPGLHASAEWLLRTWKQETWLKQVNDEWVKDKEQREKRLEGIGKLLAKDKEKTPPQWYVNGQGQTMVVIPAWEPFLMGSPPTEAGRQHNEPQHQKRIGRTFALAAKAVTVAQYQKFRSNPGVPAKYTRSGDLPVVAIDWYSAAAYCNWLSKKEGIDEEQWCYEEIKGKVTKLKANYLSLSGYRLPTEAEMEYATRAGALTSRYYGETEELLEKYAWYFKNAKEQTWPVGSLKPNDLGLFDVQGNVFTWCQESYQNYPINKGDKVAEDREDGLVIVGTRSRMLRGGSFDNRALYVRSALRNSFVPATRFFFYGFRPARTLPLDGFSALLPLPEGAKIKTAF